MTNIIATLQADYPHLVFTPGKIFSWAPETQEIFYVPNQTAKTARWSLLHETGHALLSHQTYETDFRLLRMEVAAWEKAQELAKQFNIKIDTEHIQDCLDTYRDWLYRRSICPTCRHTSAQQAGSQYRCFNCRTTWSVTRSRFCRAYRSVKTLSRTTTI